MDRVAWAFVLLTLSVSTPRAGPALATFVLSVLLKLPS